MFNIHAKLGFDGNLARLVKATTRINPSGKKFEVTPLRYKIIQESPSRAISFLQSPEYGRLKAELDAKVEQYKKEILIVSLVENTNIRGRVIEYLIAGENEPLKERLAQALHNNSNLPYANTTNTLADYVRGFNKYNTGTDIKTKIMVLSANPKGYNIDKLLKFLAIDKSVFLLYFIGIDHNKIVNTVLTSLFQTDLLKSTILQKHWAGRNSRGVTQFEGKTIIQLIYKPNNNIDKLQSSKFLKTLIEL